ncbi:RpiB/LacA/LacB family sugar-phosphate isomerase [Mycoplasmopsis agassizii]|uniref:RpiB/LacA/LacB family sugar-phosphate isomerase n=1 Tax=Mycoplasmopsis agassizii TaxID=33922 RepID=A0ABX4H6F2_9BACT|nr:RpiB/LacA/LacB family sugar-phosphate isomerase [Mycoplasmopsis agassizii]PAF55427.1 RpiB/LacA/LacB family sugar-phosphate isomerase [Mycoplasmopsis agassizii]SMC18397.1 ribose 5-phosphate isomerase B [Mycoplasmopsis agassizii]
MAKKIIALGSDHAGYKLKTEIIKYLQKRGYETVDVGNDSESISASYATYGHKLANYIQKNKGTENEVFYGIGVCGTGLGISYALNRHEGIVAARVSTVKDGALAKQHNNANVLCFGGRIHTIEEAEKIIEAYENETFEGGRHMDRIKGIDEFIEVDSEGHIFKKTEVK